MVLLGLGFGLPLGFVDAEALAAVPPERSGAASGVINLFRVGSEAVAVAAFGWIVSTVVTGRLPGDAGQQVAAGGSGHPDIYQQGFMVAAVVVTALVLLAWLSFTLLMRGRTPTPQH